MRPDLKAVIFDLDGTLVDSVVPIVAVLERMLASRGIAGRVAADDVKKWVSYGAERIIQAALGDACGDMAAGVAEFRSIYANTQTPSECLYEGIVDTLGALAARGLQLAICSNKPQRLCLKVLEDTRISGFFSVIVGGDVIAQPKPHPAHLLATLNALGMNRAEAMYIGDSSIDVLAARAAGVPFLLARYGYADAPLLQMNYAQIGGFESPKELPALLAQKTNVPVP